MAQRGVGWGHARGDGRGVNADWGEQMAAQCREACDGQAMWGDISERDEEIRKWAGLLGRQW